MKRINAIKQFYLVRLCKKEPMILLNLMNELNLRISGKNTKINKEMVQVTFILYKNMIVIFAIGNDGYSYRFIIL